MAVDARTGALKNVWWLERDRLGIAKVSDSDTSTDYVSPSEVKTVTVHFITLDKEFSVDSGLIGTFSDYTPTPSGAWGAEQTHTGVSSYSTSGSGVGLRVTITTDDAGLPFFTITDEGTGYAVSDTIVFRDPDGGETPATATVTVATVLPASGTMGLSDSPDIPEEFHDGLTYYAIAKGYELSPQTLQAGQFWRSLWKEQISEAKRMANKNKDGTGYHIRQYDY